MVARDPPRPRGVDPPERVDAVVGLRGVADRRAGLEAEPHRGQGLGVLGEERADRLHVGLTRRGVGPARRGEGQEVGHVAHEEERQAQRHEVERRAVAGSELDRHPAAVGLGVGSGRIAVAVREADSGRHPPAGERHRPGDGRRGRGALEPTRGPHALGVQRPMARVLTPELGDRVDQFVPEPRHGLQSTTGAVRPQAVPVRRRQAGW